MLLLLCRSQGAAAGQPSRTDQPVCPSRSGALGKAQEALTWPQVPYTATATRSRQPLTLLCVSPGAWEAQMCDATKPDRKRYRATVKRLRLSPAVLRAGWILGAEL